MIRLIYLLTFLLSLITVQPLAAKQQKVKRWDRSGLRQYAKEVQRERQWIQVSEGSGYPGDIEEIMVAFACGERLTIPEARRVFVPEVLKATAMIQAKQPLRKLKENGPFVYKYLFYRLSFYPKSDNTNYPEAYPSFVLLIGDKILYAGNGHQALYKEPFEEAVRILEAEEAEAQQIVGASRDSQIDMASGHDL